MEPEIHTYKIYTGQAICIGCFLAFVLYMIPTDPLVGYSKACAAFVIIMIAYFLRGIRTITLDHTKITERDLSSVHSIDYQNIAGWELVQKKYNANGLQYLMKIHSKNEEDKVITIFDSVKIDAYFKNWIMQYPNLTQPPMSVTYNTIRSWISPKPERYPACYCRRSEKY